MARAMNVGAIASCLTVLALAGAGHAAGDPETRIAYTAFVQTEDGYCGGGGNVGDAMFHALGVVSDATGQGFPDANSYCLEPAAGASRLDVTIEDERSNVVYARVAELRDGDAYRWYDVCGADSIDLDPSTERVTLSLMPYGQTGDCLVAGPPTRGVVVLAWS